MHFASQTHKWAFVLLDLSLKIACHALFMIDVLTISQRKSILVVIKRFGANIAVEFSIIWS